MVDIEILYNDDCPSFSDALIRVYSVLADLNITAKIRKVHIKTRSEAQKQRFIGSPTIRIAGQDIVPPTEEADYGLTCRVYRHENGRFSAIPSEKMIRDGILRIIAQRRI